MRKPPQEKLDRGKNSRNKNSRNKSAPDQAAFTGRRPVFFDGKFRPTPTYARAALAAGNRINGPALIEEHASTTVLDPGDRLEVDPHGNLVIKVAGGR
jgi:N-methylhydantoinase A